MLGDAIASKKRNTKATQQELGFLSDVKENLRATCLAGRPGTILAGVHITVGLQSSD